MNKISRGIESLDSLDDLRCNPIIYLVFTENEWEWMKIKVHKEIIEYMVGIMRKSVASHGVGCDSGILLIT